MSKIKILLVVLAIPVLAAAGFAAYVYGALHVNYSSGERSGFVQKLSKKGWVSYGDNYEIEITQEEWDKFEQMIYEQFSRSNGTIFRLSKCFGRF